MAKINVKNKVEKNYPEFVNEVASMPLPSLEKRLSTYAKENEKVQTALEENEKINDTKELLSELKGPFTDAKKAIRLKTKYIIELIKEKGGEA